VVLLLVEVAQEGEEEVEEMETGEGVAVDAAVMTEVLELVVAAKVVTAGEDRRCICRAVQPLIISEDPFEYQIEIELFVCDASRHHIACLDRIDVEIETVTAQKYIGSTERGAFVPVVKAAVVMAIVCRSRRCSCSCGVS
jgi:hypothetical protein